MASRAIGAVLAFAAAMLFATSLLSAVVPKQLPGWWDGNPTIAGKTLAYKELRIGPLGAVGCNRGDDRHAGDGECQPFTDVAPTFQTVGYAEGGLAVLAAVFAVML